MGSETQLLTWHDTLAIAAVIFAITQFMETNRWRRYLFNIGWLRSITVFLVAAPIILIIIANAPPSTFTPLVNTLGFLLRVCLDYVFLFSPVIFQDLLNCIPSIQVPKEILTTISQFLSTPLNYEKIALYCFSLLLLLYLAFLKNPNRFKPRFNTKFLDRISWELLDNMKEKDLAALSKIIRIYLEKIVSLAAIVPRPLPPQFQEDEPSFNNELALRCKQFIDVDLSGDNFITYISRENVKLITAIIEYSKKCKLWRAGHSIFFDNLFDKLLEDKHSVLTRELKFGGYSGIAKPLSKSIFKSMELIDNFNVFGALSWGSMDVSETILRNVKEGLEMSLKTYYATDRGSYVGNPSIALGRTINNLAETFSSICLDIADQKEEVWRNKHAQKISLITSFFRDLEYILTASQERWGRPYNPIFTEEELAVQKHNSVSEGIVEGYFKLFEGLAYLRNEDYARQIHVSDMYWLLYHSPENNMIKVIQEKLLEKIKERVEENFKGHYRSVIRLFVNLYGFEAWGDGSRDISNPIAKYFKEITKTRILPEFRKNKKFREINLPSDWIYDRKGNLYTVSWNKKKIIIERTTSITKKVMIKKSTKMKK